MNLDYTQISTIVASFVGVLSLLYIIGYTRKMNKCFEPALDLVDSVSDIFRYKEDEDGNVKVDARLANVMKMFTNGVAKSIQMSIMGQLSGPARLDKGLKGAIAQDVVEKNVPVLGLVGDFLGINTTKYIKDHPDAMMQLARYFAPTIMKMQQGMQGQHNSPGSNRVPSM